MIVLLDNTVSFDSLAPGDVFEHTGRLFIKTNTPGTAVALDNGGVDSSFTGANAVAERELATVVGIPSSEFTE